MFFRFSGGTRGMQGRGGGAEVLQIEQHSMGDLSNPTFVTRSIEIPMRRRHAFVTLSIDAHLRWAIAHVSLVWGAESKRELSNDSCFAPQKFKTTQLENAKRLVFFNYHDFLEFLGIPELVKCCIFLFPIFMFFRNSSVPQNFSDVPFFRIS